MYKIGYISGMFDILHIGHVNIIKYAKEMCEHLIVAVGTDDFLRWRKKREPFMTYDDRAEIIAALRYVDEVVACVDLDKIKAFKQYRFDVMFVGSDHINESIYIEMEKKLKKMGVKTIYYPRIPNKSSTGFRHKININNI